MKRKISFRDVRGQGIVEYVLMLALVAFAAVAGVQTFACEVDCGYVTTANELGRIIAKAKKLAPGQAEKCSKPALERDSRPIEMRCYRMLNCNEDAEQTAGGENQA